MTNKGDICRVLSVSSAALLESNRSLSLDLREWQPQVGAGYSDRRCFITVQVPTRIQEIDSPDKRLLEANPALSVHLKKVASSLALDAEDGEESISLLWWPVRVIGRYVKLRSGS